MAFLHWQMQFLVVFFCIFGFCYSNQLKIKGGKIVGTYFKGLDERLIYSYKGIKFGEKPIRFQYSEPAKPWEGVLNATVDGPACIQRSSRSIITGTSSITGQEDCLYLTCYTPYEPKSCKTEEKLPVMVFFVGGAYRWQGQILTDNNVQYLMTKDVILVTCHSRVDVFGWLSTEDEIAPGNYGLYDNYLALKWVNENIEYFGGDPKRVTIVGQSSAAAMVHHFCYSPLSKGLFQRMISQSGTIYVPAGENYHAAEVAKELGEICGCPTSPSSSLIECLTEVPADQILEKQAYLFGAKDGYPAFLNNVWGPVFTEPFFPCNPFNESGCQSCSKPWINGFVTEDGDWHVCQIYQYPSFESLINQHPYPYLTTYLEFEKIFPCKKSHPAIMDGILDFYFSGQPISRNNTQALADFCTDYGFYWPSVRASLEHPGPVYYYRYGYILENGETSLYADGCPPELYPGPAHKDDLLTLLVGKDDILLGEDLKVVRNHVDLWANFAKTGYPTRKFHDVRWDTAESETDFKYLNFGKNGAVREKYGFPYPKKYAFWKELLRRYGGPCKGEYESD